MIRTILTFILAIAVIAIPASAKYSGGTGEPNTPYQIADTNDLLTLSQITEDHNKYIILIADINLADSNFTDCVIPTFSGNFNGNNYTISNIYIQGNSDSGNMGFWRQLSSGTIQNLNIENINIENLDAGFFQGGSAGGLAGNTNGGIIENCTVTGSIIVEGGFNVAYSGGLVGQNSATLNNCSFEGSVIDNRHAAGGLVGRNLGPISNCTTNCYVQSTERTGGLVGVNYDQISNCFAIAHVDSSGDLYYYDDFAGGFVGKSNGVILNSGCIADINCPNQMDAIGGFAGLNHFNSYYVFSGIIKNCYCQSAINANNVLQVGGFIGNNGSDGTNPTDPNQATGNCVIENCYSATGITLDNYTIDVGGFAGANFDSRISNCYWNQQILPPQITQSIAYDVNSTTENLLPLNTDEMKTQASYTNWDFINIWNIGENQTYPFLRQYKAGDLNHDGIVNFTDFAILADDWLK